MLAAEALRDRYGLPVYSGSRELDLLNDPVANLTGLWTGRPYSLTPDEGLENGEERVVMKIPAPLAPIKVAVMPLVKKDGLPEVAQKVVDELKYDFSYQYDEKDSIGKRYRRQAAIGTPYCVTVDHDTLQDGCVTLRFRDTMEQERVSIADLNAIIEEKVSITSLLKKL
jgi:glycyl-tRNA synthetase